MLELAKDTDHGGRVNFRSLKEAYQARYLRDAGVWTDLSRGPQGSDFLDGAQPWDLKTETSNPITSNAGYSDERMHQKIQSKLDRGIHVAIDQTPLHPEDRERLRNLIANHSEWRGKVFAFESRATPSTMRQWRSTGSR